MASRQASTRLSRDSRAQMSKRDHNQTRGTIWVSRKQFDASLDLTSIYLASSQTSHLITVFTLEPNHASSCVLIMPGAGVWWVGSHLKGIDFKRLSPGCLIYRWCYQRKLRTIFHPNSTGLGGESIAAPSSVACSGAKTEVSNRISYYFFFGMVCIKTVYNNASSAKRTNW